LSPDFSTFLLNVRINMFPRAADLRAAAGQIPDPKKVREGVKIAHPGFAIYSSSLSYEAKLPEAGKDIPSNVKHWQANKGALLRKAWAQALHEIPDAIASDLQRTAIADTSNTGRAVQEEKIKVDNLPAIVVHQSPAGKLVRFKDGTQRFIANLNADTTPTAAAAVSSARE
jgi:hypothetical protein